jgi:hypothetical protein
VTDNPLCECPQTAKQFGASNDQVWPIRDRFVSPNPPFSETYPGPSASGKSRPRAADRHRLLSGSQIDSLAGSITRRCLCCRFSLACSSSRRNRRVGAEHRRIGSAWKNRASARASAVRERQDGGSSMRLHPKAQWHETSAPQRARAQQYHRQ